MCKYSAALPLIRYNASTINYFLFSFSCFLSTLRKRKHSDILSHTPDVTAKLPPPQKKRKKKKKIHPLPLPFSHTPPPAFRRDNQGPHIAGEVWTACLPPFVPRVSLSSAWDWHRGWSVTQGVDPFNDILLVSFLLLLFLNCYPRPSPSFSSLLLSVCVAF